MRYSEAKEMDKEFARDTGDDMVYVDWSEEANDYGVFGFDSGFCYLISSERDCEEKAEEMNSSVEWEC